MMVDQGGRGEEGEMGAGEGCAGEGEYVLIFITLTSLLSPSLLTHFLCSLTHPSPPHSLTHLPPHFHHSPTHSVSEVKQEELPAAAATSPPPLSPSAVAPPEKEDTEPPSSLPSLTVSSEGVKTETVSVDTQLDPKVHTIYIQCMCQLFLLNCVCVCNVFLFVPCDGCVVFHF